MLKVLPIVILGKLTHDQNKLPGNFQSKIMYS